MLRFLLELVLLAALAAAGWTRSYHSSLTKKVPALASFLPQAAASCAPGSGEMVVLTAPVQFALDEMQPSELSYLPQGAILLVVAHPPGGVSVLYGDREIVIPQKFIRSSQS